jgi:hypothetical protein
MSYILLSEHITKLVVLRRRLNPLVPQVIKGLRQKAGGCYAAPAFRILRPPLVNAHSRLFGACANEGFHLRAFVVGPGATYRCLRSIRHLEKPCFVH